MFFFFHAFFLSLFFFRKLPHLFKIYQYWYGVGIEHRWGITSFDWRMDGNYLFGNLYYFYFVLCCCNYKLHF